MISTYKLKEKNAVEIPLEGAVLHGDLAVPENAFGIVVFAHGSGSSRLSPRNQFVAESLQKAGLATLLMDLLTEDEEETDMRTAGLRFDVEFLSGRLIGATEWLKKDAKAGKLNAGYFGASTGAAAALIAAAKNTSQIRAVVSRGGRPDLAMKFLPKVKAPTLLIVGSFDDIVIGLNKKAMEKMDCLKKMEIVQGASHLFEEPGTLEEVAKLSQDWFVRYLG